MPPAGQKNGLKLAGLRGAEYDDGRWEKLPDQLTVDEMKAMIAHTWNADQIIRNGGSAFLTTFDVGTNYVTDSSSATGLQANQPTENVKFDDSIPSRFSKRQTPGPAWGPASAVLVF